MTKPKKSLTRNGRGKACYGVVHFVEPELVAQLKQAAVVRGLGEMPTVQIVKMACRQWVASVKPVQ